MYMHSHTLTHTHTHTHTHSHTLTHTHTHSQVHVVLSEVDQEVENDDIKLDPPSDHEGETRVDYIEEDENLSDTDSEDEWDKPTKV